MWNSTIHRTLTDWPGVIQRCRDLGDARDLGPLVAPPVGRPRTPLGVYVTSVLETHRFSTTPAPSSRFLALSLELFPQALSRTFIYLADGVLARPGHHAGDSVP